MNNPFLLLAIIQPDDADAALKKLAQAKLPATRISSVGGFLNAGNVTLLLGLDASDIERAKKLLAETCRTRMAYLNMTPHPTEGDIMGMPIEVEVGGATLFTLKADHFVRLGAHTEKVSTTTTTATGTKLIIALTPEHIASQIVKRLTAAQYRATRISSTGGFLRKGNETLFIGVESQQVDDVLQHIETVCQTQPSAKPDTAHATLFVVDVSQFLRI